MHEKQSMTMGEIIENRNVAPGHFQMIVHLPQFFADPQPGQFVMIRDAEQKEPLLSRPFSIYGFQRQGKQTAIELLYRVVGEGTIHFSRMRPGEKLSILGPLGRGFSIPAGVKRVVLVAGGVGVAPLTFLLNKGLRQENAGEYAEPVFYLGARSEELLTGLERLNGFCDLRICTDDGSRGYCGPVTGLLKLEIGDYDAGETVICACGPAPMIRTMGRLLQDAAIRCQVSLEERMACGLGACLGCAVKVRSGEGRTSYQRVCREGPVFDLREILFASPARV